MNLPWLPIKTSSCWFYSFKLSVHHKKTLNPLNNKQILYQGANITLGRKLKLAIATGRKTTQLSIATSTLWILWIDIYEFVMISYHKNLTDIFITLQDSYAKIE